VVKWDLTTMAMMRLKHENDVIEIVDLVTSFARRIDDENFLP